MAASSVLELTLHLDLNLRCDLDELFFGNRRPLEMQPRRASGDPFLPV